MLLPSLCIMSPRSFNTPLTYHSPALSLYYLCLVSYYCGYVPVSCCHHSSPKFARPLRTVIIPDTFPGVASARFVSGIFSQLVCVCVRAHTHTHIHVLHTLQNSVTIIMFNIIVPDASSYISCSFALSLSLPDFIFFPTGGRSSLPDAFVMCFCVWGPAFIQFIHSVHVSRALARLVLLLFAFVFCFYRVLHYILPYIMCLLFCFVFVSSFAICCVVFFL